VSLPGRCRSEYAQSKRPTDSNHYITPTRDMRRVEVLIGAVSGFRWESLVKTETSGLVAGVGFEPTTFGL
jgi:hypothetical protein